MRPEEVVSAELARFLCGLSHEIRRQIGVLIDRSGVVKYVMVGDDREIMLPDLSDYALGRSGLRGLRCIHTHLKNESLSEDDLTDLALLRLDMMVALGVNQRGFPASVYYAHLLPENPTHQQVEQQQLRSFDQLNLDMSAFLRSLEDELERTVDSGQIDLSDPRERAILISVSQSPRREIEDSLCELQELARTADMLVLDQVVQRPQRLNPRYLMGEGKIKDVVIRALQQRATMLVFDQDLSPTQVRSIAALTDLKVVDRSQVILDIFARRAHTLDGKVQVELAQLKYILPRLSGKGTALSRLMGGIGGRGPGETKLEIDRRRIRDRISRLEKRLKGMAKSRLQRRSKRMRSDVPIISIVGYTNAGKSTLLNALTQSEVFTEDLLFATLDTSTRRLRFPLEREVIITDTVGFIRQLPASLMGAFKSTLEELSDADLLLHVVDVSNPRFEEQILAVEQILADLDLGQTPRQLVFNKMDQIEADECAELCRRFGAVSVCARDRSTFDALLDALQQRFWPQESEGETLDTE
ncbi:GTPase HflX [Desulfuromonas acetoxidans]|uniref:GTPase HflX n=1 Tax=Desulfuromonas acetoxidans TaxID=891 RepID=UPI0015943217|nr:GTPase HflX [Desulfuromonas acetoxidans]NVD25244.1 GTPase HflX [Desulfuromonas acetoxidans]NVE17352.1 GTPase HflX [Desulfuromonas acetoxidans]